MYIELDDPQATPAAADPASADPAAATPAATPLPATDPRRYLNTQDEVNSALLSDYFDLTDVALRRSLEVERGLFMAESTNVISRAIAAGYRPRSVLMARRWKEALAPILASSPACEGRGDGGPIPVFLAREDTLRSLVGFHLHRGALAAMERHALPTIDEFLVNFPPSGTLVILDGLVDHTNVGAAFRSAAALGVDAVVVTNSCADPYYRRSIRVSMGTVFQVPWTRIDHWPRSIGELRAAGFHTAALALSEDSIPLADFVADAARATNHRGTRLAVIFGTEGHGLSPAVVNQVDSVVRIPMAHGVDSLNVAATVAVVAWALNPR